MFRLILVAALAASLVLSGCTSKRGLLPPDRDPDELAAAIARRGRGEGPPTPDGPRGSPLLGDCLETAGKVLMICVCVPFMFLYLAAQSHPPAL